MQLCQTSQRENFLNFVFSSYNLFKQQVNGEGFSIPSAIDLENFKADIIQEVKLEIAKAKQEIIEGESEFDVF